MTETIRDIVTWLVMPLLGLGEPGYRLYWGYLLAAILIGLAVHAVAGLSDKPGKRWRPRDAIAFLFPRAVYTHRSAGLDVQLYFLNSVVQGLLFGGFAVSEAAVATLTHEGLALLAGPGPGWHAGGFWLTASYTIAFLLVYDFSRYAGHWLQHRIPLLWEFHKVHHSAHVLTPLTLYRVHPLGVLPLNAFSGVCVGALGGLYLWLTPEGTGGYTILGVNALLFLVFLQANLRHSHIPLSFGRFWNRLIISPLQHQIHHSSRPDHFDRNFGASLAIWDWMFGSLVIDNDGAPLNFGLGDDGANYDTVWRAYTTPFVGVWRRLRPRAGSPTSEAEPANQR